MRNSPRSPALKSFFLAYLECALWSSTTWTPGNEGRDEPLDERYDFGDVADEAWNEMLEDCEHFVDENWEDVTRVSEGRGWDGWEQAGHDFWLSRNGRGAGFFDRGLGKLGDRLQAAARVYGSCDLYVGDDQRIYA